MFENEVAIFENGHLEIKDGVDYLENKLWVDLWEDCIGPDDVKFVSLPDSLLYMDPEFFAFTHIREIIIPNGIKLIENKTFYCCMLLETITISKDVKKIGHRAFQKCRSLEKIILPNGLEKIGQYVFDDCTNLKEVRVPRRLIECYGVDYIKCNTHATVIPNDAPIVKVDEAPKEVVVASEVVEKSASIKCYNGVIKKSLLPGRKNQSKGFSGNFKK